MSRITVLYALKINFEAICTQFFTHWYIISIEKMLKLSFAYLGIGGRLCGINSI